MKEQQQQVDLWIKKYGVRYFNELTNTVLLMEEVGEFSRLIARKFGEQSFKHDESEQDIKNQIEDEMTDILFVLFCLANQMELNLEEAFQRNLIKKSERDSKRHFQNPKIQS